jgi:hypothetical protein
MKNVATRIAARTAEYAVLPLFRALSEDRVPVTHFPEFFKEQYMATRWFQDLIWAATDIADGPYAAFARSHRKRDSGHHKWVRLDLAAFGMSPMTDDDWFRLEWLPTRIQMSRILALCHGASPEARMTILAAMESAGEVTLGTLHAYVVRHGLAPKTKYLGDAHMRVEEQQVEAIHAVAAEVMKSEDPELLAIVDVVFDAFTWMFEEGGRRYWAPFLGCTPAA